MNRGRRRAPAVVTALFLLVGAMGPAVAAAAPSTGPSAPAHSLAAADGDTTSDAHLELTAVNPAAPKPDGNLTVKGNFVHPGGPPFHEVQIGLQVSSYPVTSRGDLAAIAGGAVANRALRTVPATTALGGEITSGKVAGWTVTAPVASLGLRGNGVYVLQVTATGRGGNGGEALRRLATMTTLLPYLPDPKSFQPTKLTWLWPLAATTPSRDAHGVLLSSATDAELVPGGRLADLAAAPGRIPVTWMVDPEVLESAQAMAQEHEVQNGRSTRTASADPAAAQWLTNLRGELSGRPVAALPYADPDVAALTHHGNPGDLTKAFARSRTTTGAIFGREADTNVAWPPDGMADTATLGALRRAGVRTVVLSSSALVLRHALTYTPTGRARVDADGAPLDVLVADQALTDALSGDLTQPGAAALAEQRFLAETALITLEHPNSARTILATPPRRWAPPQGWAANLLDTVDRTPWVQTVGLAALSLKRVPTEYQNALLTYPQTAAAAELAPAQVARMVQASTSAADVVRVLTRPGALDTTYTGALFSAVSSAWRSARPDGRAYALQVGDRINGDIGEVRVLGRNLVTLSSTRGTIPLTVSNDLGQAIRVRPVLRPRVGSRLTVTNPELLTIGAGRKATVRVPAEASANGITQVDVQLLDATGQPFGAPMQLRVNVTSFGKVGLIVLIAAGGVLFGAAILRNVRRLRNRSAEFTP